MTSHSDKNPPPAKPNSKPTRPKAEETAPPRSQPLLDKVDEIPTPDNGQDDPQPQISKEDAAYIKNLMQDPEFKWLKHANDSLQKSEANSWDRAQKIIGWFFIIFSTIGVGGFVVQLIAIATVAYRASDASAEIAESKKQRGSVEETLTTLKGELARLKESEQKLQVKFDNSIAAASVMNKVIGFMQLSQQSLSESNAAAAIAYASHALTLIDEEVTRQKDSKPDTQTIESLNMIRRPLWILQCESYVQMDRIDQLAIVASNLTGCNCPEEAHYNALTVLDQAADERTEPSARIIKLEDARNKLENATTPKAGAKVDPGFSRVGNFDLVLLGAAYFERGNVERCRTLTKEFLDSYAREGSTETGHTTRVSGQVAVAQIWADLCDYVDDKNSVLEIDEECVVTGAIRPIECRVLLCLLSEAKDKRVKLIKGDKFRNSKESKEERHKKMEEYCIKAAGQIESLKMNACQPAVMPVGAKGRPPAGTGATEPPPPASKEGGK